MSAKSPARKKKVAPSKTRSPAKGSGLTLEVPATDAATEASAAVLDEQPASPSEAEDIADHVLPPDLQLSPPSTPSPAIEAAAPAQASVQPAEPGSVSSEAVPTEPESIDEHTEATPATAAEPIVEPVATAAPLPQQEMWPIDARVNSTPVAAQPATRIDQWLQRIGRTLPIHDWAFSALRSLATRQKLLGAIDLLLPAGGQILEVGCGAGLFAAYLASTAPARQILALHAQESLLRRGQRLADELALGNLSFQAGDVLDAPLPGEFDAIYAIDSLHRIPPSQLVPTLQRLAGLLRPGGTLVIHEISSASYIGPSLTQLLGRVLESDAGAPPSSGAAYRHHDDWLRLLGDVGLVARLGHVPDLLQANILITATRPLAPPNRSDA